MDTQTYTLKQVVSALNRTGTVEEASRITRHIRHWTSMDLLEPQGAKHTGTGRSREYSADSICRAAVLVELAKWRVPMTVLADTFSDFTCEFDEQWEMAKRDEAPVYLMLTWHNMGTIFSMTVNEPNLLVIDEQIGPVQSEPMSGKVEMPASVIVMNLSRLLRWLKL